MKISGRPMNRLASFTYPTSSWTESTYSPTVLPPERSDAAYGRKDVRPADIGEHLAALDDPQPDDVRAGEHEPRHGALDGRAVAGGERAQQRPIAFDLPLVGTARSLLFVDPRGDRADRAGDGRDGVAAAGRPG